MVDINKKYQNNYYRWLIKHDNIIELYNYAVDKIDRSDTSRCEKEYMVRKIAGYISNYRDGVIKLPDYYKRNVTNMIEDMIDDTYKNDDEDEEDDY